MDRARIHRGTDGVTITFESDGEREQEDDDRALKERAIAEAPVGAVISDPDRADNPLIYVNETFERVTGYNFDDIVGQNCRFLQGKRPTKMQSTSCAPESRNDAPSPSS